MRLLNSGEQKFCRRILNGDGKNNYLSNIIDDHLDGVRISITRNPRKVDLHFTIQSKQPTNDELNMVRQRSQDISLLILNVVNLIKLLEKENYIMLLQRATQVPNQFTFGRGFISSQCVTKQLPDPTISSLLIDYIDKEIFVTEEFRQFCQNGFIARDEQRFRRQICITTSALCVAVLSLLVNTVSKCTGGTKIKQEQIDSIRTDLHKIDSSIDALQLQFKTEREIDALRNKSKLKTKIA